MIRKFRTSDIYKNGELKAYVDSDSIFVFEDKHRIKGYIIIAQNRIEKLWIYQGINNIKIASKLIEYVRRNRAIITTDIFASDDKILRVFQNKGFKIVNVENDIKLTFAWAKGCMNIKRLKGDS